MESDGNTATIYTCNLAQVFEDGDQSGSTSYRRFILLAAMYVSGLTIRLMRQRGYEYSYT